MYKDVSIMKESINPKLITNPNNIICIGLNYGFFPIPRKPFFLATGDPLREKSI